MDNPSTTERVHSRSSFPLLTFNPSHCHKWLGLASLWVCEYVLVYGTYEIIRINSAHFRALNKKIKWKCLLLYYLCFVDQNSTLKVYFMYSIIWWFYDNGCICPFFPALTKEPAHSFLAYPYSLYVLIPSSPLSTQSHLSHTNITKSLLITKSHII